MKIRFNLYSILIIYNIKIKDNSKKIKKIELYKDN